MAPMASTVVHPRCVLPLQDKCFAPDVRGYITSSSHSCPDPSWHFTKLQDASRQRWFLGQGLGLLRREEWMRLLGDPSVLEALGTVWRLFYCEEGLLAMVACESPVLDPMTLEPVLPIRDKLRAISHAHQAAIVASASSIGLGVVLQRQPSTRKRAAVVGHDPLAQVYQNVALTPVSSYPCMAPTDKFVQLALAPLLPAARAGGPVCRVPVQG